MSVERRRTEEGLAAEIGLDEHMAETGNRGSWLRGGPSLVLTSRRC